MAIRLIQYLKRVKPLNFIFIGQFAVFFISVVFGLVFPGDSGGNPLLFKNKFYIFIMGVLLAPVLETIIFQAIPFFLIRKYVKIKKKLYLFIFASPVLFIHTFNIGYGILSYLVGCIFAFMYFVAYYRRENAIKLIILLHFSNNLVAYFIHFL